MAIYCSQAVNANDPMQDIHASSTALRCYYCVSRYARYPGTQVHKYLGTVRVMRSLLPSESSLPAGLGWTH
jgi:hypothetical protein